MRKGRSSQTAGFVAFNRGLGNLAPSVPGFSDPIAERFLPEKWARDIAKARRRLPRNPLPIWIRGMGVFNQFRTVVLDRAIGDAAPVEQLVILGAGFDGRAWRMPQLAEASVFEVDHPDTQRVKRERSVGEPPACRAWKLVPVDFARDDLATRLGESGHDRGRRTFWLWEGVTMYLERDDVQRTLATMAELSAPGSRVALTYLADVPLSFVERATVAVFNVAVGEPMRSRYTVEGLAGVARAVGWETHSNTGIEDWKRELAPASTLTRRQVGMQWQERIWVGRR